MIIFSIGARDALTKSIYGINAKSIFPRLGKFNINDIKRSIRNKGRYYAVSYPGVIDETSFHGVKARSFYVSLHDEGHRRLISTIPNQAYDALLHAIDIVRDKTGITWSKEIWDTIDMAVGEFLNENSHSLNNPDEKRVTECFLKLLSANVYIENRPVGLFSGSSFFDTTWLLMIDIAINKEQWINKSINPEFFNGEYKKVYLFIENNIKEIENEKSFSKQVAILKSKYFNISTLGLNGYEFKKKHGYIQLVDKNRNPLLFNKSELLSADESQARIFKLIDENKLHFTDLKDKKIISFLEKKDIYKLIDKHKLTISDLKSFSSKQIEGIKSPAIDSLILKGHLTIEQFRKLSPESISQMRRPGIYYLIKANRIFIHDIENISAEKLNYIDHDVAFLIEEGKLKISQIKKFPMDFLVFLKKNIDDKTSVEDLQIIFNTLKNKSGRPSSAFFERAQTCKDEKNAGTSVADDKSKKFDKK